MNHGTYTAVKLGPDFRPSTGETIASAKSMAGEIPASISALWEPGRVVICWNADAPPPKQWPKESLASARRKRLRRRLETKLPLFADEMEARELAARPSFYNGERE